MNQRDFLGAIWSEVILAPRPRGDAGADPIEGLLNGIARRGVSADDVRVLVEQLRLSAVVTVLRSVDRALDRGLEPGAVCEAGDQVKRGAVAFPGNRPDRVEADRLAAELSSELVAAREGDDWIDEARSAATFVPPWQPLARPDDVVPIASALTRAIAAGVPQRELSLLRALVFEESVRTLLDMFGRGHFERGDLAGLGEEIYQAHPDLVRVGTTGARPARPRLSIQGVTACALSSDGGRLVVETGDVYDTVSGQVVAQCRTFAHPGWLSVSANDRYVAITSSTGKTALCDLSTGERVGSLTLSGCGGASFSPDSARVYLSGPGGAYVWDVASGRELGRASYTGRVERDLSLGAGCVTFTVMVAPSTDFETAVWDDLLTHELRRMPIPRGSQLCLSPDGGSVWLRGQRELAKIDLLSGTIGDSRPSPFAWMFMCPDGSCAVGATPSLDGMLVVRMADMEVLWRGPFNLSSARFSRNGRVVALVGRSGLEVWDFDVLLRS